jgi:hypothetical protein
VNYWIVEAELFDGPLVQSSASCNGVIAVSVHHG